MDVAGPRYLRVVSALQEQIDQLGPSSLLPTEEQLAKKFRVSRVTVRRALDVLDRSGLISRERGRGTIVNSPKITRRFSPLYTFEEDLKQQGIEFETRIVDYNPKLPAPDPVRARLGLKPGSTVGFLSLERLVDDRIISHDRRHFQPEIAERFDPTSVETRAVSDVIEGLVGQSVTAVDWESEIISASAEIALVLRLTPGTLIVANTFTYYLESGTPIESGLMSYRVDRCKFKFEGRFNQSILGKSQDSGPGTANGNGSGVRMN